MGTNNQSYICDTGHCCGQSQCCNYYYELWCKSLPPGGRWHPRVLLLLTLLIGKRWAGHLFSLSLGQCCDWNLLLGSGSESSVEEECSWA